MLKRTLLSLAIGSTVFLAGCGDNGDSNNAGAISPKGGPFINSAEGRTYPLFNPALSRVPVPSDIQLDQVASDGTFSDAPVGSTNPVQLALGKISGASLIAPIDIALNGAIDPASVNANFLTPGLQPNPQQNVFLIELAYPSGDPIQGLLEAETPTIPFALTLAAAAQASTPAISALSAEASKPSYVANVIDQGGVPVLRIQPTKPLKPKTRYLVVVTDSILDAQGQPLIQDPAYQNITDETLELPSSALVGVRDIVNDFWEVTAETYLKRATNATRTAVGLPALDKRNVALTYSFTTTGDEKVLEYQANPAEWFNDQLTTFARLQGSKLVGEATGDADNNGVIDGDLNGDGAVDYFDRNIAANSAVATFPDAATAAKLPTLFGAGAPCAGASGPTAIGCMSTVLSSPASIGAFIEKIGPRTVTPSTEAGRVNVPLELLSAPVSLVLAEARQGAPTKTPMVSQGTIKLPYFLGVPDEGSNGSVIQSSTFVADAKVGDQLNAAFASVGLALPQGKVPASVDKNGEPVAEKPAKSNAVNYIFPFLEKRADLDVPYVAIYPADSAACPRPLPVVIYQHGITTDRSAALSAGGVLAENCFATIAIDQPLHGVSPYSTAEQRALAQRLLDAANAQNSALPNDAAAVDAVIAKQLTVGVVQSLASLANPADAVALINNFLATGTSGNASLDPAIGALESIQNTVANAGSTIPGLAPFVVDGVSKERHFSFTADASGNPIPMNFDPANAVGDSGSLYINLTGFVNGRDKNRQSVIDLLNLRASISAIDVDGPGTTTLDNNRVYFMGHSLGTVAGTAFTAVTNSDGKASTNVLSSSLLTPASGLARMLENSPSFAPRVVGGLAAAGVEQGTANYEIFMRVLQASLDPVDPIAFADNLNTSINYQAADPATATPTSLYDANASFQTSAVDTGVLLVELTGRADANGNPQLGFLSDQTNPIETEVTQLTTQFGTPFPDLLSGNSSLAEFMGATNVLASAAPAGTPDVLISRLDRGSHGMFVLPVISTSAEAALFGADAAAEETRRAEGFSQGIGQSIAMFSAGGELANSGGQAPFIDETIMVTEDEFKSAPRNARQLNLQ
ncbi:MAG: hypothetical protein CME36_13100 [unclassified Hahellaceae]|nr:hypothetical protein [Hahellaceae bacterium]|tara:strand:+ start:12483 stop:15752 length:3270 start_codon:yes stop_codon:yes gene_type:complete